LTEAANWHDRCKSIGRKRRRRGLLHRLVSSRWADGAAGLKPETAGKASPIAARDIITLLRRER